MLNKFENFIKEKRIIVTNVFYVSIVLLQTISQHTWAEGVMDLFMELIGLALIGVGSMGRLWTSLYISGNKTRTLITDGPYSIVRNPLYFFSFIAMLGIGFSTERFSIILAILVFFAVYYPTVIVAEQKKLLVVLGAPYASYMKRVPSFIPSFKNFNESKSFEINTKECRKAFSRGLWFIWLYMIFGVIESLQDLHYLPVLFRTW